MLEDLHRHATEMYARVNAVWKARKSELFDARCGFSILSGPPIFRPELLIVGANPGFGAADLGGEAHVSGSWPERSYIDDPALGNWRLAHRIRDLFAAQQLKPLLSATIQTNFQVFKSGSVNRESPLRWDALPPALRAELDAFSYAEIAEFIRLSEPKRILIIGFAALKAFCEEDGVIARNRQGHRLLVRGRFGAIPMLAVPHLSTARITREDWTKLKTALEAAVLGLEP